MNALSVLVRVFFQVFAHEKTGFKTDLEGMLPRTISETATCSTQLGPTLARFLSDAVVTCRVSTGCLKNLEVPGIHEQVLRSEIPKIPNTCIL